MRAKSLPNSRPYCLDIVTTIMQNSQQKQPIIDKPLIGGSNNIAVAVKNNNPITELIKPV